MVMSVDMPEALEQALDREVNEGIYSNKSEAVRDAVRRMLEERGKLDPNTLSRKAVEEIKKAREEDAKPLEL